MLCPALQDPHIANVYFSLSSDQLVAAPKVELVGRSQASWLTVACAESGLWVARYFKVMEVDRGEASSYIIDCCSSVVRCIDWCSSCGRQQR